MKFLPTINLWSNGIQDAITSGQLKLQVGQWVKCGEAGKPARYAGMSDGGTLYVAHDQGSPAANADRFTQLRTINARRVVLP